MSDPLADLGKTFPIAAKIANGTGAIPRDSSTGELVIIRVLPKGEIGYSTPWSIVRHTVRGKRYYRAEWMDTYNRALFTRKSDAADFLDLHRYAVAYRRLTGELPAWATDERETAR